MTEDQQRIKDLEDIIQKLHDLFEENQVFFKPGLDKKITELYNKAEIPA